MQVQKINLQQSIPANNRSKTQNQTSEVSFGTFGTSLKVMLPELLEKSKFEDIKFIKNESIEYLRKHPIHFDIEQYMSAPFKTTRTYRSCPYSEEEQQVYNLYDCYDCNIATAKLPQNKARGCYPVEVLDAANTELELSIAVIIKKALKLAKKFDKIKRPQEISTVEMNAKKVEIETRIREISDELTSTKTAELMEGKAPTKKDLNQLLEEKATLEKKFNKLNTLLYNIKNKNERSQSGYQQKVDGLFKKQWLYFNDTNTRALYSSKAISKRSARGENEKYRINLCTEESFYLGEKIYPRLNIETQLPPPVPKRTW